MEKYVDTNSFERCAAAYYHFKKAPKNTPEEVTAAYTTWFLEANDIPNNKFSEYYNKYMTIFGDCQISKYMTIFKK